MNIRKTVFLLAAFILQLPAVAQQKGISSRQLEEVLIDSMWRLNRTDTAAAKAFQQSIIKQFPHGLTARRVRMEQPMQAKSRDEYLAICKKIAEEYPYAEYHANPDRQGFIMRNFYNGYLRQLWGENLNLQLRPGNANADQLRKLIPLVPFSTLEDIFLHGPQWIITKGAPVNPQEYYDIAKLMLDEMTSQINDTIDFDMYGTAQERLQQKQRTVDLNNAIFADIAQQAGHPDVAIAYMEKIPIERRYIQYPNGNLAYIHALQSKGRNEDAIKVLEGSAAEDMLTTETLRMLREHFDALNPKPAKDFNAYQSSLRSEDARRRIMEDVRMGLVDEPFTPFVVDDIHGGKVSSADFGNQIVIIDFWATWCAPCIAALEGMQLAVDRYEGDPDVRFLFMDGQEEPRKEAIERVWKRKNLKSNMLVTFENSEPGKKDYSAIYRDMFPGTSGIPQKAVLKNGRLRYRAQGYSGSPSGLMEEIVAVVELLKAE